ncbi:MAG TPA: 3-dehydroquinate synthase [Casimicrobiaceae bacterium]|nr:3-dehydroquinate synthase [Casimicrobiaceae bacterium]
MRTLTVALGERSYPIHVGEGILSRCGELLPGQLCRRAVVVTNPVVASLHLDALRAALSAAGIGNEVIVVPDGEAHKDWATLYEIHTRLLELGAERSTTLFALGGGVIGDLAGFAAATYQRGIPIVQLPTTLLAQVDSSVGGKTAVNHPLGKNMIGVFYQPRAVISDTATLSTLPDREYIAGIAEVIKCGAVRDLALFEWLEANMDRLLAREPEAIAHAVLESCRIKAEIVVADERETGARALLNFGHTFGHAIETATGYGAWLHGEAVAAGMVLASRLSVQAAGLSVAAAERVTALVRRARLPTDAPPFGLSTWHQSMAHDKKSDTGVLRFVLLEALGRATVRGDIAKEQLAAVLGN